jgi:hypothetical protein
MTAAVGIDVGMEIDAAGRSGIVAGRSQAATAFPSSKGQNADWLIANQENSKPSVSGAEGLRSRWQTMLNALVTGPVVGQKAALSVVQGTGWGTGQGKVIEPRLGTEIESGSEYEQSEVSGEVGGAIAATLAQRSKSGVAAVSPGTAGAVLRSMQVTHQTGVSKADTTELTLSRSQGGNSEWMAAVPQVQFENATQISEASSEARTGHSVKSDKRDTTVQHLSAEPQAAPSNNGAFAAPMAVTADSLTPASAMQAQILPANFVGSSQSALRDRVLSSDREPDTTADGVTGSATVSKGATGAAPSHLSSRAAAGNPVTAPSGGSADSEAGGAPSLALWDGGASAAKRLAGLSPATGAQAEATLLDPAPSQHRTGNGSPLVEAVQAPAASSSETYHAMNPGTNLGAEGISFASRSPAATSVAEKSELGGGKQSREETTARLAHGDSAVDRAQPARHVVLAQQAGAGLEAWGTARVPASAEGTASVITTHVGVSAGIARGAATGETFAAMDAEAEVGAPGWIHAGSQSAEAGFQDPALGWVGVRADLSGGNVHAALMPGSAEAAQTLSGHLAGLNSYLAEQHTPVASLTIAGGSGSEVETGAGQNLQQGAGQNLGQDAERNSPAQSQSSRRPGEASIPVARDAGTGGFDGVVFMAEVRGGHISVMA